MENVQQTQRSSQFLKHPRVRLLPPLPWRPAYLVDATPASGIDLLTGQRVPSVSWHSSRHHPSGVPVAVRRPGDAAHTCTWNEMDTSQGCAEGRGWEVADTRTQWHLSMFFPGGWEGEAGGSPPAPCGALPPAVGDGGRLELSAGSTGHRQALGGLGAALSPGIHTLGPSFGLRLQPHRRPNFPTLLVH